MKREWIALGLLLLLLAASLGNILLLDRLVDGLEHEIALSESAFERGAYGEAGRSLGAAAEHWQKIKGYTHIFIRHTEIDSVSDAFFELKQTVAQKDGAAFPAAREKLLYHLRSIDEMEHLRLGSVL